MQLVYRTERNALKATGPRTPEGKSVSSQNAIKHGLTARQTVIPGESQSDFDQLLADIARDRQPEGEIEIQMLGEIAACTWRLARARRSEAEALKVNNALFSNAPAPGFDRLMRYMAAIERQLNRAVVRLQQLQAERRKLIPAPQPAAEPLKVMAAGSSRPSPLTLVPPPQEFVSSNAPTAPEFVSSIASIGPTLAPAGIALELA